MKKFIFITLAALVALFASCNKEAVTPEPEMVNVTFDYKMVESNSMVRSATDDAFITDVTAALPTTFSFDAVSSTGITYSCSIGQSVTLPVGTYSVELYASYNDKYGRYPSFKVVNTFSITKNTSKVTLSAEYTCYVLIFNVNTETWPAVVGNISTEKSEYWRLFDNNHYYYIFVRDVDDVNVVMQTRASSEYVQTNVVCSVKGTAGALKVENGKYYFLHPEKATKSTVTSSVTYPDWVSGGSNI